MTVTSHHKREVTNLKTSAYFFKNSRNEKCTMVYFTVKYYKAVKMNSLQPPATTL